MLIFCGKTVGAELLSYLVERGDKIERVIVADSNDHGIISLSKDFNIEYEVFDNSTYDRINARGIKYSWILSLWNPHIIPKFVLQFGKNRLNLHPSLLPFGGGSDSSAWAIRENSDAGVSLIDIVEEVDAGGIYAQARIERNFPERGIELHAKLQSAIIKLFKEEWPRIQTKKTKPQPQQPGGSFHRRKETNLDRVRDSASISSLGDTVDWILAHDFYPGTTAEMTRQGKRYRLKIQVEPFG